MEAGYFKSIEEKIINNAKSTLQIEGTPLLKFQHDRWWIFHPTDGRVWVVCNGVEEFDTVYFSLWLKKKSERIVGNIKNQPYAYRCTHFCDKNGEDICIGHDHISASCYWKLWCIGIKDHWDLDDIHKNMKKIKFDKWTLYIKNSKPEYFTHYSIHAKDNENRFRRIFTAIEI